MKLTRRQLYDYTDVDRGELKLIRVGHAIWTLLRRERRQKRVDHRELRALDEAIETMVRLKQEYRAALKVRRAEATRKLGERLRGKVLA